MSDKLLEAMEDTYKICQALLALQRQHEAEEKARNARTVPNKLPIQPATQREKK